jgi:hypothetical protein
MRPYLSHHGFISGTSVSAMEGEMWAAVIEVEPPMGFGRDGWTRAAGAVRYAGVLVVWAGLAIVRPRLAMQILRERRPDSPLGRQSWPSGLTVESQRKVRALRRR